MKALVFALPLVIAMSCNRSGDSDPSASGEPVDPSQTASRPARTPGPDHPAVVLTDSSGNQHRVFVEVVRTTGKRRRGLMYRQHLGVDRGMLFIFDEMRQQSFWMKNTLIPLDIMFIKDDLTILGIVQNARPKTKTPRRVAGESIYVLEVNGGWTAERTVGAGTTVTFENVDL